MMNRALALALFASLALGGCAADVGSSSEALMAALERGHTVNTVVWNDPGRAGELGWHAFEIDWQYLHSSSAGHRGALILADDQVCTFESVIPGATTTYRTGPCSDDGLRIVLSCTEQPDGTAHCRGRRFGPGVSAGFTVEVTGAGSGCDLIGGYEAAPSVEGICDVGASPCGAADCCPRGLVCSDSACWALPE